MDWKMSKHLKGFSTHLIYISSVRHKTKDVFTFSLPEHKARGGSGSLNQQPGPSTCRGFSMQRIICVFSKNKLKMRRLQHQFLESLHSHLHQVHLREGKLQLRPPPPHCSTRMVVEGRKEPCLQTSPNTWHFCTPLLLK